MVRAMETARAMAFRVLRSVETGSTWDRAWREAAAGEPRGSRERRFAHELASGTLRLQGRLDWRLGAHARRPLHELDPPVRTLLRLGAYQLCETNGVAPHAAVFETVQLAKRWTPRAAPFVNAILRALQRAPDAQPFPDPTRDPLRYLAAFHSHPEWLVERWLGRFGFAATAALLAYDNQRPELCLRVNRMRGTAAALASELPGSTLGRWSPDAVRCGTAAFAAVRDRVQAGAASVQDESGMLVSPLLEPRRGARLLDLAAAPGGKTCHAAELMEGTGTVVAYDRTEAKLVRVRDNARRLGLENVLAAAADSRTLRTEPASGVLLDAPCTGLGVLARRADLRWRKQVADIARLAALQQELLGAAARHVEPGGLLVYSVCSFEPEETVEVAQRFAAGHPDFLPADSDLPPALRAGPGILYFFPHVHGMDGGFVARWRRRPVGE
jgi:16S rRNA (cytosine967-C5)-methyltransferase